MATVRINIHNCDSYIYGVVPSDIFRKLREELSFRVQNSEFSDLYNTIDPETNKRKWDGRKYLIYDMKNCLRFSTGLLSRVRDVFDRYSIEYAITDSREKYDKSLVIDLAEDVKFRPYQQDAIDLFIKKGRGVIKIATGGGKTPVAAGIFQRLGLSPMIFVAMSGDLILQAKDEFTKFLRINGKPPEIGQIGSGICDIRDINVCTAQSLCTAFDVKYTKYDEDDSEDFISEEILSKKNDIRNMIADSKCIIFDEVQHAACDTVKDIMKKAIKSRYRVGLSIFPDSCIELSGNIFKNGSFINIEDAWSLYSNNNKIENDGSYETMNLIDVYGRGWDGVGFTWKYVKKIIRHKNINEIYKISFAGKENIKITSDHSIFCVRNDEIISLRSKDLCVGDILLIDNGRNFDTQDINLDPILVASNSGGKYRVAVDLNNFDYKLISNDHRWLWQLRNRGKIAKEFGGSLNISEYNAFSQYVEKPKFIYTEGANGVGISTDLKLDDVAYMIGFYFGDGWFEDKSNRISFAVQDSFVDEFIKKISNKNIRMNFERKKLDGCCQIRISNKPLSDYLKNIIEKQNCYQKIIPNNILFSSESTRRKVLEGMIDSDGSRKRTKEDLLRNRKPTSYTTSSEKLKKCFCLLLRSLNIQYTVSERNPSTGGVVNGRQIVGSNKSWQILFSGNSLYGINDGCKGNRKRTKFNCIEKKILKIEKEVAYDGYVYDLEMDGHPSFVANGVLVHNSASPWRDDGADLFIDSQFGKRIVDISASFLIKNKWLVKPYITFIKIFTPPDAFSNYATIYKNHIVNSVQRNNCIADLALHHASKNQTVLILVRQIKHGKILESMIKDSIFISGVVNTKKRKEILDELRENKRKIVIASSLFDEGIDVRRLHCLIMASSGKSSTRALQRIGRVLRPFEDKTEAIIYDFMDSAKYLNAHAKARRKIYKTEDEFEMREIKIEDIVNEIRGNIWEPVRF